LSTATAAEAHASAVRGQCPTERSETCRDGHVADVAFLSVDAVLSTSWDQRLIQWRVIDGQLKRDRSALTEVADINQLDVVDERTVIVAGIGSQTIML
jgi:hypothetical protein